MRKTSLSVLGSLCLAASAWAQTSSPAGFWETIDDKTGSPRAVIEITEDQAGVLTGKVIKGLVKGEPLDKRCTACTDARKDQPIIGMTVVTGMHKDGEDWDGGEILDPDTGKIYRCKMHLEKGGTELIVHGFIGISLLGRSQTWVRQADLKTLPHP
jgi:uncharacterized protein (DUF2147 family)